MGANAISWKRIQRVNKELGESFVHGSTTSHGEWWWWHLIRHDGSALFYNTRTGETEPAENEGTSTQRLLRTRESGLMDESEWLAELDRRAASLTPS